MTKIRKICPSAQLPFLALSLLMVCLASPISASAADAARSVASGAPGGTNSSAPPGGSTDPSSLPLLIPIQTRVVTGSGDSATDYGIVLDTDPDDPTPPPPISAPALPSNSGYQIVYVRRSDLSVVSNVSIDNSTPPMSDGQFFTSPLYQALASIPPECGAVGCIRIVQSLGTIGFTPCYEPNFPIYQSDCFDFRNFLNELGLSSRLAYANGQSNQIAFSSISNTTPSGANIPPAGTFFERLTCSGSNYGGGPACDSLGFPNTSFTAPANATPAQLGNMAGVLVRDNYQNYTYAQNAPLVSFSTATSGSGSDATHTITVGGVAYPSDSLGSATGGFHLLILNGTDLSLVDNRTFPSQADASEVNDLYSAITGYKSYGYLFFVAAFGDTSYFCDPNASGPCPARANWYQASTLMGDLGGTQQVFYLANEPQVQPFQYDNYTLVGSFIDDSASTESTETGLVQFGAEMSSVIARETEANPPPTGAGYGADMEGFLKMNRQGFYSPTATGHLLTLGKETVADILSASLLNPTPWPFPGPDPAGSQAAYAWISQQLCCADIRSAYVNLNASPLLWLIELYRLSYDSSQSVFSQADFDAMVNQLATEFQYLTVARHFQSNVVGLYQEQQANLSLLFQNAADKILNNLQVGLSTPAQSASWTSILDDVFSIETSLLNAIPGGELVTAGTEVALTVGTVIASEAASRTNSPQGTPLQAQEQLDVAAGDLADQLATEFSATLITLGQEFDRIVTDWGRLQTLAAPLLANQVPWDNSATGVLLESYDRAAQRELYAQLLPTNFVIQNLPYTGHDRNVEDTFFHNDYICEWESFANNPAVLYYPNGQVNDDSEDDDAGQYPWEYQWGIWALTLTNYQNDSCPGHSQDYPNTYSYPDTFGLFQPLDPGNPEALGAYRYWFYTRGSFAVVTQTDNRPCYDGSC